MAAVLQRAATTTTTELQSSGDLHLGISKYVERVVNEVLVWQTRKAAQRIPCHISKESEERKLGRRFRALLYRRYKASGKSLQLSPSELDLVNSVPGVFPHACLASEARSSKHVENVVNDVLAWQTRKAVQRIPSKYSKESEESKLGGRFSKLLIRRYKAIGKEVSRSELSPFEADLVNSVPGVPLHIYSATSYCSNRSMAEHFREPGSAGVHRIADVVAASESTFKRRRI